MLEGLTWKCDVCGRTRPDEFISVFTTDMSKEMGLSEGTFKQNVRYCNDTPECVAGAPSIRLFGPKK